VLLEGIIPVLLEAIVWLAIACLVFTWTLSLLDIFGRDDLSARSKAGWTAKVILLPFFGSQLYLFERPGDASSWLACRARRGAARALKAGAPKRVAAGRPPDNSRRRPLSHGLRDLSRQAPDAVPGREESMAR
jgi:hypothetical protein